MLNLGYAGPGYYEVRVEQALVVGIDLRHAHNRG